MYSLQKGFRTGTPELREIGGRDWVRQFNTYYLRAMDRHANNADPHSNYAEHGRIYDTYCEGHSVTCSYGGGRLAQPMGGLVLTPSIFNPKPVAIGSVAPEVVTEGCAGGNNGLVTFDHSGSFHPNPESRIVAYRWDVNADDGLWWDGDGEPDFETPDENDQFSETFEFRYPTVGTFTATLQVVDNIGQIKQSTVQVTVNRAENVAPAAAHGGPYVLESGSDLELNGAGTDQNIGCGDSVTLAWDLDNDGQFDDAQGATPTVAWASIQNLQAGAPNRVRVQVRDEGGLVATAETTLTIYPRDPVSAGRAQPNPAACEQDILFDGSPSFHPNPQRSIAQYDWDVDGQPGFDGAGERFTYAYSQFGTYTVTLRVTDDLGRTHSSQEVIEVNQGNRAPVARIAEARYVVLEGDDLTLDGRASSDDDTDCGDEIAEYAWDMNGNGSFDDAGIDVQGANPTVPWAIIEANMDGPADRDTGLPSNTVTLRVTDSFGAQHTATTEVARYTARPTAIVVQTPNPAAIGQRTGVATVSLDGRESFTPVPGNAIASYEWLFDPDNPPVDGADVNPDSTDPIDSFQKTFALPLQDGQIPPVQAYLRVTDNQGRQSLWRRFDVGYDIPPTPPTADADPTDPPEENYHVLVGESVTLDGSQSQDPDPEDFIAAYRWDIDFADDFEADLTELDPNGDGAEARVEVTADQLNGFGAGIPGAYPIRLEVTDGFGQTGIDDAVLNVHAVNPQATFAINPNPVACNAQINLDASACFHPHPSIEIVSWEWDIDGNGQYDDPADTMGRMATARFDQFTFGDERRTVNLRVTDSRNNQTEVSAELAVNIGNRPPVPNAGGFRNADGVVTGPYTIAVGEGVTLSSSGTTDPDTACGDDVVALSWDIDRDGVEDSNEAQPQFTAAQLAGLGINGAGDYEVRLSATDRFGAVGTATARLIVVEGPTAVATATPNRTGCSNNVTFSAENSVSNGPAAQGFNIVRYEWDFDGDGQYDDAVGQNVTRAAVALPNDDDQIIMGAGLRVVDASGRSGTTSIEVAIDSQNVAPVADAGGPYNTGPVANGWLPVRLDGRGSRDPNAPCDEIVTYKWDTDGDGRYGTDDGDDDPEGAIVEDYLNDAWRINTVQTIRLIVCDIAGSCSPPSEGEIGVLAEAPPIGEIISPRASDNPCFGAEPFDVTVSVSDPAGDRVTVSVYIAGEEVADPREVDTPDNGAPINVVIEVDPRNLVPEGRQTIEVFLEDDNGGSAELTSGGRVLFDRTAPTVEIGDQVRDGVCYNPNQVPEPDINVEDADASPSITREVVADGCGRTLVVTATDSCGNEGEGRRAYLIAEPVSLDITGPADGSLVRNAAITWEVVGPDECASRVEANLNRAGGGAAPYNEGAEINAPGEYTLALQVANCNGAARGQTLSFIVNGPPIAVSVPNGHPNGVPGEVAYIVQEGDALQVDGSLSRSPEAADSVVSYTWDWTGDGVFDANGARANFPTEENGVFNARLQVEDSLGLTGDQAFQVTVTDVDPIADAGGPYVVPQGVALTFDGRGSRAGSAADAISRYEWDFDDGTDPGEGVQPVHTFAENGTFSVTLTVHDEDSSHSVVVRVEVRDVDPVVEGIDVPDQVYEIARMRFQANAQPGAPGDPITRYEWDFDGDGDPEYAGPDASVIEHQFHEAGTYRGVVTVRDGDSLFDFPQVTEVREITMLELIEFIELRMTEEMDRAVAEGNVAPVIPLAEAEEYLALAKWGEQNGYTGNTLLALGPIVRALAAAQRNGVNFGLELWAMSRQLQRLIRDQRTLLEDAGQGADNPSMQRANGYIDDFNAVYAEANFKDDVAEQAGGQLAVDLLTISTEAYYWLQDVGDVCYANGRFPIPQGFGDPATISEAAQPVNVHLTTAMGALRDGLVNYRNAAGNAANTGPGVEQTTSAVNSMAPILEEMAKSITFPCPEGTTCVTDREALDMELRSMELVAQLTAAAAQGVWVRNWQACLTHALKFRIEISLLRVEFLCGANLPYIREARNIQSIGLDMFNDGDYPLALEYYADDERRCMMIDIYNRCIVPEPSAWIPDEDGNMLPPAVYDLPEVCEDEEEDQNGGE
jgi:PKD repeat protein